MIRLPKTVTRLLVGLTTSLLFSGCMTQYDVTMGNGNLVRARTKPVLDAQGCYVFQDLAGQEVSVNALRVRKIEAVRRGSKPSSAF